MSGYIKYFNGGGKNMSFKIKDILGYTETWNKIEKTLGIRFHSQSIFDDTYIETKVRHLMVQLIHFFQTMKFQKKKIITFVFRQYMLILS